MGSIKEVHHNGENSVTWFILVCGILWFFFRGDPDITDSIHDLILACIEYVKFITGP